jgi:hypothetical protein
LQASKFDLTLHCFAKSLIQMTTPNSTFRPFEEDGDEDREVGGDFAERLSFLPTLVDGETATAIRDGAGAADFVIWPMLVLTIFPEDGLCRTT